MVEIMGGKSMMKKDMTKGMKKDSYPMSNMNPSKMRTKNYNKSMMK